MTLIDPAYIANPIVKLGYLVQQGVRDFEPYGWMIKCVEHEGLCILNYTQECNVKPVTEWKGEELVSRGLIIGAQTGEIAALPFAKFFNVGQMEADGSAIESVTAKMDGSLGILYRVGDEFRVATRGSFVSDQALFATEFLSFFDLTSLHPATTLLFEIIYPENRVVIDYGDFEGLVLIGACNRFTGRDQSWGVVKEYGNAYGFPVPADLTHASLADVVDLAAKLGPDEEGFVVRLESGLRLKVKGEEYLKMHRFVSNFSLKAVAQAVHDNKTQEAFAVCPDHFRDAFIKNLGEVTRRLGYLTGRSQEAQHQALIYAERIDGTMNARLFRKRYADCIMNQFKDVSSYAFALLDGRDIEPMIYRNEWGIQ